MGRKRKEEEKIQANLDEFVWAKLPITISETMKAYLGEWAAIRRLSMAEVSRVAIANYIGYNLEAEPKLIRKSKYGSPEEKKVVYAEKAKAKNILIRRLLDKAREERDRQEKAKSIKALEDSLTRKGVKLDK